MNKMAMIDAARREHTQTGAVTRERGTHPHLSVVIVNWNTRDLLRRALESLTESAGETVVQVIVVDNGSRDGSVAMVRTQFPHVVMIENSTNTGFARANNQGAAYATAPILLLLNSDAAVRPFALAAAVAFMATHPEVGIVGPQLLNDDLTLQTPGERLPTLLSTIVSLSPLPVAWRTRYEQRRSQRDYSVVAEVETVCGAALLIRRDLFQALCGFDESFFFTGEEVDLCWRARKSGNTVVYLPTAQVIHSVGGARRGAPSIRHGLMVQRGRYRLLQQHRPPWEVTVLRAYLVAFTAVRLVRVVIRLVRSGSLDDHRDVHLYARELFWLLTRG